jgi:ElaB/YqjD/DUF883 family membrane-anchored ribosome-binding protein
MRKREARMSCVSLGENCHREPRGEGNFEERFKTMKKDKENIDENKVPESVSEAVPPAAEENVESGVSHARKAADDFKSAAGAVAGEYRGRAEEVWNDARYRVRGFQEDSEQYVRENPTKAIFTALGVGFVLGLIFRR